MFRVYTVVRGAKDKRSLVQWTCIYTVIVFLVKKLDPTPSASGSYVRQADKGFQNLYNPLQVKLFEVLLC